MALVFHKLVSVEEALSLIEKELNGIDTLGVIEVPLFESVNKVLAEDLIAPIDYPPFDRSTVDGYAVRSIDIAGASEIEPKELEVIGKVEVGTNPTVEIKEGKAAQISTGAMVPRGADAIVMEEYVSRKENKIIVYRMVSPGENISMSGSDIATGDTVIRKGTQITPRELAVFAGLGLNKVKVYKPPKIIVYSTGVEIEEPGKMLSHGKVYDTNGYVITSMLKELGSEVYFKGILPDNYEKMKKEIENSLNEADILITTGSTSAGYGDMIYKVFNDIGAKIIVHGLKSRPGKPTAIAVLDKKILFGLPGFPLSAMMNLYNIVEPVVRKMMGKKDSEKSKVKAKIPFRLNAGRGFTELIPVQLVWNKDSLSAYPILSGSGSIAGISISDGYIVAEENREYFEENEDVDVYLFSSSIKPPSLTIIGSNCPGIEVVLGISKIQNTRIINVGSMGGWQAIKRGDADLAGSHLLDESTMNYNIHIPKIMSLEDKVYIYRGYSREVGILIKKGNPKKINGVKDFLRDDIVIINRNKGSGTRVLLDKLLKDLGVINPEKIIRGYMYEVKTHSAVATAILQGRADAGMSLRYMAETFNLDFIPIGYEIYDFVVRKDKLENKYVEKFIETLRNDEFFKELERRLPGYKALKESGNRIYP